MTTASDQNAGSRIYIGCSGWAYPTWKPAFYPEKLPSKKFLEYYATRLNSVEVNYTFRSFPRRTTVDAWLAQTGEGFRFSFKAPQRITHFQRLQDCRPTLEAFAGAIAPVARRDGWGRFCFSCRRTSRPMRGSWRSFWRMRTGWGCGWRLSFGTCRGSRPGVFRILERHEAALCVAESDELATPDVVTAPFSCYRRRKTEYSDAELETIAGQLRERAAKGDVFAYFKHEEEPTGALWAAKVLALVRGDAGGGAS